MPFQSGDRVTFTVTGIGGRPITTHEGVIRDFENNYYRIDSRDFPFTIFRDEEDLQLLARQVIPEEEPGAVDPLPSTVTVTGTSFTGGLDPDTSTWDEGEMLRRFNELGVRFVDPVEPPKPTHPESVKIIDWKESAKLFGNTVKRKMLANIVTNNDGTTYNRGTVCKVATFQPAHLCKKDGIVRDTYTLYTIFGTLRYLASEVKEVKKSATQPKKDRTIKTGVEVRVINNRHNNLSKEKVYKVETVEFKSKDHFRRAKATIIDTKNNTKHITLLANLKRI